MNSSAPTVESAQHSGEFTMQKSVEDLQATTTSGFQPSHTPVSKEATANTIHGTLESKRYILLKKMENIEKKNVELLKKIKNKSVLDSSSSAISHSSPKKSHKCDRHCRSDKHKGTRCRRAHFSPDDSEEDSSVHYSSNRECHNSSLDAQESTASSTQVSLDFLKSNDRVQRKV